MSKRKIFQFFVYSILILELAYSFTQHYHEPLDGDVAHIAFGYQEVLNDPFGLTVIFEGSRHANPNRFFVHSFMSGYVKQMPLFLQKIFDPIDSIYIAFALFKTGLQILLIFILSAYISGTNKIRDRQFVIATLLVFPLLQMTQFNQYMGVILSSITYSFFYTLPFLLLMLLLFPLYKNRSINFSNQIGWVQMMLFGMAIIILSFSGPLMPPVIIIIAGSILLNDLFKNFKPKPTVSKIGIMCLLSILAALYSLYIGTHNTENTVISLSDRYQLFFKGLYNQLTRKLCFPILLSFIIANLFLIYRNKNEQAKKLLRTTSIVSILILVYLMLLPFGGYRSYRPEIINSDTFMPVTLAIIYLFGITTLYLLNQDSSSKMKFYKYAIASCLLFFILSDEPNWGKNHCEKDALQKISATTNDKIELNNDCTILSWDRVKSYDHYLYNPDLLRHWNVTEGKVLYNSAQ